MSDMAKRLATAGRYLRQNLGRRQVYVDGAFRSFSQAGDFHVARLDPETGDVLAKGPNPLYPVARLPHRKLTGPQWENKLFIVTVAGQSTANGAGTGVSEEDSGGASILSVLPPKPGKLLVPKYGTIPNPAGAGSPANARRFSAADACAELVDAREAINVDRDPGKSVSNETPGLAFALVLAHAIPDSSKVALGHWAAGSSSSVEVIGRDLAIVSSSWSGGVATHVCLAAHRAQVGSTVTPTGVSRAGYNAAGVVQSGSTGTTLKLALASDPGGTATGGSFDDPAIPAQNGRDMVTFIAANHAGDLDPVYLAHLHMGHQGDSAISIVDPFVTTHGKLRQYLNAWALEVDPAANPPKLVWPAVGAPRKLWNDDAARIGEASWHAMGQEYVIANGLDANMATFNKCFGKVGNDTLIGTPHYDAPAGYPPIGMKAGSVLLDMLEGTEIDPPVILSGTPLRFMDGAGITATMSGEFEKDTTEVHDPDGNGGIQVGNYASDLTNTAALTLKTVSSVAMATTALTTTLSAPGDPRREYIAVGFKVATEVGKWNGQAIVSATWSAGEATLTLGTASTLVPGDTVNVFNVSVAGYNGNGFTAAAGTSGTTVKYAVADPGGSGTGGNLTLSASHGLGRRYGNRTPWRLKAQRHFSILDGAPLNDYAMPHIRKVKVVASSARLSTMLSQCATYIPGWTAPVSAFDVADASCYGGTGQTVTNLGSSGTTNDRYLGTGSGSDSADPTFVGTAGTYDRGTCFQSDGADHTSPKGAQDIWTTAHQAGGAFSGFYAGVHKTSGANQYWGSTCQQSGGGAAEGVGARIGTTDIPLVRVAGAANATVYTLSVGAAIPDLERFVVFFSVIAGGRSFIWLATDSNPGGTLVVDTNTIYSSPSAGAAQSAFTFGVNPGNTDRWANGTQWHMDAQWNNGFAWGDLEPLAMSVVRRHLEDAY
jgi:hypothetical protein